MWVKDSETLSIMLCINQKNSAVNQTVSLEIYCSGINSY